MSDPFHGVLPALITPFTDDGSAIDADALAAIVERLIGAGVGGLVPGGSTGEFTTLTHAERRQLTEITVAAAAGRVPVVAGTGALSTRETVQLSVHAEQAGAAAVVWGVASIVPAACVELHRLLIDDIALPAARELWARLWPLCQFLEAHSYPAAVKTACRLMGDTTGPVRAPLLPLDDAATSELTALLKSATLAKVASG